MERITDYDRNSLDLFEINQALGKYNDVHRYSKFGRNPSININGGVFQDIWTREHNLTYLDTETTLYIVSTDATDTQKVAIDGVSQDYTFQRTTVDLQGTTPVQISGNWLRVFRISNINTHQILGSLFVSTENSPIPTDNSIQAHTEAGDNQTFMSHFTIPKGYVALVKSYALSVAKNKDVIARPMVKEPGGIFLPVDELGLYQNSIQKQVNFFRLPTGYDIKFMATSENNGTNVSVAYTVYLFPDIYNRYEFIKGNYLI